MPKQEQNTPALRFPEFDGDWHYLALNAVTSKIQDGTHFSPQLTEDGKYLYITSKNIRMGYLDLNDVSFVSEHEHRNIYKRCDVSENDVLLTKDGASTGNVCINTLKEPFSLLSSVAFLRANPEKCLHSFLYQILASGNGQRRILESIAGQAITRITLEKLRSYKFFFPKVPEQKKIAAFLGAVDEKIAQLQKKKDLLEVYKKGCMQKLFSQAIRFTDDNGNPFPDWGKKTVANAFSPIPTKRFQIKSNEILETGEIPVVDQGQSSIAGYTDQENKIFNAKEIPVVIFGDHTTAVKFLDFKFVVGADGTKILSSKGDKIRYLYYALQFFNVEAEGYKRHFSILKEIALPIPHLDEQKKIADFLSEIDNKIALVSGELNKAKIFKKGLLQQMFV